MKKVVAYLILGSLVVAVLAVKWATRSQLVVDAPPELNGKPAVLYFYSHEGCPCMLEVAWRQDNVVSDSQVFDLAQAEEWLLRLSGEVTP